MMRRILFWALLLLILAGAPTTDAFFAKSRTRHHLPSPGLGNRLLSNYCNDTTGKNKSPVPFINRQDTTLEAIQKSTINEDKKRHRYSSFREVLRQLVSFLGQLFYTIKVNAALVAIHFVLSLKMEGPVLRRLPPHLLLFLLEVSVRRPQVIQAIAKELGERISSEITSFTGKEHYQVGDITKAIVTQYTGKDDYQFGDLTSTTLDKIKLYFASGGKKNEPSPSSPSSLVSNLEVDFLHQFRQGFMGNPQEPLSSSSSSSPSLESILFMVTGKKEYEFGDVTKAVLKRMQSPHS